MIFRAALVIAAIACGQTARAAASWVDTNFVSSPVIHLPLFIPAPPSIGVARAGAISSIAPMPDGRIYVGGAFTNLQGRTRWGLARLQANGTIDDSFDPSFFTGKTNLGVRLFVEPSGSLLVQATYANNYATNFFLRVSPADDVTIVPNPGVYTPLVIQTNGKVIALAASQFSWSFVSGGFTPRVVRLNSDLTLDTQFRETTVFSVFNGFLTAGMQPDGKVILWTDRVAQLYQSGSPDDTFSGMLRLLGDGTWDAAVKMPDGAFASGVIFPDGKIACRATSRGPIRSASGLILLTPSGVPLPSFGQGIARLSSSAQSILTLGVDGHLYETTNAATLTRFSPEGTIDTNFSLSITKTNASGFSPSVSAVAALPDGSLLVAGSFDTVDGLPRSGIVRIRQPDAPTHSVVEFVSSTNYFTESTLTYPIILKRTGNTNIPVSVGIARTGGTAGPGDFSFVNSVTFQPGETTNAIATGFPYDGIAGNDRTAVLSLQTSTEGAAVGTRSNQFITLIDRELAFQRRDGDEAPVLEGSAPQVWDVLMPVGTIKNFVRVYASITGVGYDATNDFPGNVFTGALSSDPSFLRLVLKDNLTMGVDRLARMDLSFTNFSREPDLRLLVTNLSVFLRIFEDDSPAGPRLGLTNGTVRAFPLPTGQVAALGGSRDVCILAQDLVRGAGFAATGSQSIATIAVQPAGMILVGGSFSNLLGSTNRNVLRITKELTVDPTFAIGTGPDGSIAKVFSYSDGRMLVSGAFSTFSGLPLSSVARLGTNGAPDPTLNVSNLVASPLESGWLLSDGAVLVRLSNNGLRLINPNNSLAQTFTGSTEFSLNDARLAVDGKIVIAQRSGSINGVSVTNIMRLTATGQRDLSFNAGTEPTGAVSAVCPLPDGRIWVGGSFSTFNNIAVSNLVILKIDGTTERSIAVDGSVHSVELLADGSVLVGGTFQNVAGVPRRNVARITADGTLLPQAPALLSEPIAAGQRVHIRTEPGMRFQLQSSSNLVNWTTTTNFTARAYSTAVTNPPAAPGDPRFLRAIANP